ncbi:MAG: hypothetical protein ACOYIR_09465 [Christensenellales bacterium]
MIAAQQTAKSGVLQHKCAKQALDTRRTTAIIAATGVLRKSAQRPGTSPFGGCFWKGRGIVWMVFAKPHTGTARISQEQEANEK